MLAENATSMYLIQNERKDRTFVHWDKWLFLPDIQRQIIITQCVYLNLNRPQYWLTLLSPLISCKELCPFDFVDWTSFLLPCDLKKNNCIIPRLMIEMDRMMSKAVVERSPA